MSVNFKEMILVELKKVKRSKLLLLILIPPLLVVISGVTSISQYFSSESPNAWSAMFVQSALLFGYYLLPLSMVVVCVMIAGREINNNGILKMLALPISRKKLALAKFMVLLSYLVLELVIFFLAFVIAGMFATKASGINETLPIIYILKWSGYLFLTSIPCVTFMWMITVLFEKPILSIGLNLLLIIPGVLVANTPLKIVYPYCYSGYLVSTELHILSTGAKDAVNSLPFVICSFLLFAIALLITLNGFGKKEMK